MPWTRTIGAPRGGLLITDFPIMYSRALPGRCRTAEENENRPSAVNKTERRIFINCEVESETKALKPQAFHRVAWLLHSRLRRRSARCLGFCHFFASFNLFAWSNCF